MQFSLIVFKVLKGFKYIFKINKVQNNRSYLIIYSI